MLSCSESTSTGMLMLHVTRHTSHVTWQTRTPTHPPTRAAQPPLSHCHGVIPTSASSGVKRLPAREFACRLGSSIVKVASSPTSESRPSYRRCRHCSIGSNPVRSRAARINTVCTNLESVGRPSSFAPDDSGLQPNALGRRSLCIAGDLEPSRD